MPTEIYAVFHSDLPSKAALTRMFTQLGFPLSFQRGSGGLDLLEGLLAMRLRGDACDVEYDTWDYRALFEEIIKAEVDLPCGANFHCGSRKERIVAVCLAAAVAKLTDGFVMGLHRDPKRKLTADEAIVRARENLEAVEDNRS